MTIVELMVHFVTLAAYWTNEWSEAAASRLV